MMLRIAAPCALLLAALTCCNPAYGQSADALRGQPLQGGSDFARPDVSALITAPVDETKLVRLPGNTHPMARAEFDRGPVDPNLPMERMLLVLDRSAAQEAALDAFMERQLNPASRDYRRWLSPAQFGALYGPSDRDIEAVTSWLQSHGFTIDQVSPGRNFIQFSGTSFLVERAFHTPIHRFDVDGEAHISNVTDPSIPEALRPVVAGVASLNDFHLPSSHIDMGSFRRDASTGKWSHIDDGVHPDFGVTYKGTNFELVTPYDFASIYNVTPLWNSNIDGTGVTIAVAGRSNISLADVATFRSAFGLPAKAPTVVIDGTDPGMADVNSRQENTLDVEWAGAVAKGATIKLVIAPNTIATDGEITAALYAINKNLAPILSFSYGNCELFQGATLDAMFNKMWQQAAAQGISVFVSTGDSGAGGCETPFTGPTAAQYGLAVSGTAATPYNVAVGGTDIDWANLTTTYWKTTNAANGSSVLGYIPEVPWNASCASDDVDKILNLFKMGLDEEQSCQYVMKNSYHTGIMTTTGGGGGASSCTAPTGSLPATCAGGYAKPAWQAGTGVPADGKRDIPDVSLFASAGALNSAYLICDSASTPCTFSVAADATAQGAGGTSVATPAMAGIMAMVLQKAGGVPQGLPNPTLYELESKENLASCSSFQVAAGNSCVFYDITTDNNALPCAAGTRNCTVEKAGDLYGILSGNKAGVGYDLATGLGSVNANNLVNAWSSAAPAAAVTITPASVTFPSTLVGHSAPAQTVTVKNTGTGWLNFPTNSVGIFGTDYKSFPATTTCNAPVAPGASCVNTITFTPQSAGALTSNLQIGDNAPASPQIVPLKGTGSTPIVVTLSTNTLSYVATTIGTTSAYNVVFATNTSPYTVQVKPIAIVGPDKTSFAQLNTCGNSLAGGASCYMYVVFQPQTSGNLTATLNFTDSADSGSQSVALSGAGEPAPVVAISPLGLNFGTVALGTTSPLQTVTIVNDGTWFLQIETIQFGGASPSAFFEYDDCQNYGFVYGGESCTVQVAFKPTVAGTQTANMYVFDNGTGSPQYVAMNGVGK